MVEISDNYWLYFIDTFNECFVLKCNGAAAKWAKQYVGCLNLSQRYNIVIQSLDC